MCARQTQIIAPVVLLPGRFCYSPRSAEAALMCPLPVLRSNLPAPATSLRRFTSGARASARRHLPAVQMLRAPRPRVGMPGDDGERSCSEGALYLRSHGGREALRGRAPPHVAAATALSGAAATSIDPGSLTWSPVWSRLVSATNRNQWYNNFHCLQQLQQQLSTECHPPTQQAAMWEEKAQPSCVATRACGSAALSRALVGFPSA